MPKLPRHTKNRRGVTKNSILLFIAMKGECKFLDIRKHLDQQFGINNLKTIYTHLKDLEELYIDAAKPRPEAVNEYQQNIYRIKPGYVAFERLFIKFRGRHIHEFMETKYYQDFVKSNGIINQHPVNAAIEFVKDGMNMQQIIDRCTIEDPTRVLENNFCELCNVLLGIYTGDLPETITELVQPIPDKAAGINWDTPYARLTRERAQITKILLISPSAVEYVFFPKFQDPQLLSDVFNYMLGTKTLTTNFFEGVIKPETTRLPRDGNDTLLLTMLKSLLKADLINGRLLNTAYTEQLLDELLPKTSVKT